MSWGSVFAQQKTDTTSIPLTDFVITGQYSGKSKENSVQRIKVIDRAAIDAMNAQNLTDVLSNRLNIRISQDDILGSSMSMQGISGENVKILIDGIPMIGRQSGNLDLSQINLSSIERIEVIEGPMSVNFGTNALAGTINLITKKDIKGNIEGLVSGYYESIGTYNLNARVAFKSGNSKWIVSGFRNFFDGWSPGEKPTFDFGKKVADSTRYQIWKPREQYQGSVQWIYNYKKWKLNYQLNAYRETILNPGKPELPYYESAFDDAYYTTRLDNALFADYSFSDAKKIHIIAAYNYYNRIKNTWFDDLTTLTKTLTNNEGDQDTSSFRNLNLRGNYTNGFSFDKLSYELGYDINIQDASGVRISNGKKSMGDYALYASAEYKPVNKVTVRPGLRVAYNTEYASPLIPSINVLYKPDNHLSVRTSYSKGFRAPDLKELYFYFVDINHDIIGNSSLKAEYSDNYGASTTYKNTINDVKYSVECATFYNNITNLITLAQTSGTEYTYINLGKFKTKGVQVNGEIRFEQFIATLGYSYIGSFNQLSESEGVPSYSYSNEFQVNLSYELTKLGLTANVFYKYNGKLPSYTIENNVIQQNFISAYQMADASISKNFFKKKLVIAVGCKNLFDVKSITANYISNVAHTGAESSIPMACGRLYFLKTTLSLSK